RTGRGRRKLFEPVLDMRPQAGVMGKLALARIRSKLGGSLASGVDIEQQQRTDEIAVKSGKHHIANIGSTSANDLRAHRCQIDPGSGCQLEVFGCPPVENKSLRDHAAINELQGVA